MTFSLIPIFMIGLLGSVHCIGMCGGIVSALSIASSPKRPFPVAVAGAPYAMAQSALDDALRVVVYNAGRIGSYALAGAIAGGIAQSIRTLSFMASIQIGGYWLANLMLIVLGLYLMDIWRGLTRVEAAGQLLWRRLQPLTKNLLPMDSLRKAFLLGAVWGWVPCGMVYSVLLTAMMTGSALSGASVMLAFGLGTMPVLLSMGLLGKQLQRWTRQRSVRIASGLVVLLFGVVGIMRAAHGLPMGWLDTLCVTPSANNFFAGAH